ncbi:MAG: efflux transporter outer membrane subunit [Burkholderiales bacterium]
MKRSRLAAALLCVSTLAGCSMAPTYRQPVTPVPAAYKGAVGIWKQASPSDRLSRGDWWKIYNDALLDKLIVQLDAANADLAAAVAHFDQATAYAAQANSYLFPTVNAGTYVTRNRQSVHRARRSPTSTAPNVYGDNAIGLMADYEVDLWGRVHNLAAAGEAGAQAAAEDLESIRLSLRAQLADDYLALRSLDAQSRLLEDEVAAYTRALALTRNRFEGGIDSALDVSRAKAQLDTANAKRADIAASRALYEHAIATLVGVPASGFSIEPVVMDMHLPEIPIGVPATLLQRRPDIAAAERRLFEANARIGIAKAAFFPTVMLGAGAGYESTYQSALITAPNLIWSIGPSALLTLFDAGRREAMVEEAQAAYNVAGAQYRSTVLRAFQEVEDNLSLLNELSKESVALKAAVVDTKRTLELAMNRYREGVVNYLEVVTAQTAAQQAQLDELNLRKRRLQASVNLIRALGGGWSAGRNADVSSR